MTTAELAAACGFVPVVPGEARGIDGIFAGDLLSWAMSRAREISRIRGTASQQMGT